MEDKKNDLCERLFEFAVRVIEFLKTLPYSPDVGFPIIRSNQN